MIVDKLKNSNNYYGLSEGISKGFKYLEETNLLDLDCGIYEIDGKNIFVSIDEYLGKNIDDCLWEGHKKYIDIQYIISGEEKFGYLSNDNLDITVNYDEEKDIYFGKGEGQFLTLKEGEFIIFTPSDAHMPSLMVNENLVKKAVVKVSI